MLGATVAPGPRKHAHLSEDLSTAAGLIVTCQQFRVKLS